MDSYIMQLRRAWLNQDGDVLADLLSLSHNHATNPQLGSDAAMTKAMEHLSAPFDDLVLHHIKVISSLNKDDALTSYAHQSAAIQSLAKILQLQKDENWMLPVMNSMCLDLRRLALKAEASKFGKNQKSGEVLEKCAECLMSCFRVCAADNRNSEDDTKRWGMLALVNQLWKVYFRINKLDLCKPLIRIIESSGLKDQFALAQKITYKFFMGRKAIFDSDYTAADEYLTYAFVRCHKESTKNKRLILTYLVPVKMLLGYMPKKSLLEKYNLLEFWELVEAVKRGNLRSLEEVMNKHEIFFISAGIYLIVEKLKLITYRNLFKKVYLVLKTHLIPVASLLAALEMHGVDDVDMDETECLVANLIYEGKIKGYISHQHKKLVISKQNPFPQLSSLNSN
ncbi:PCI domain-containing protein 2 [Neodiprion virginianus]|uniref:PCI domain-containing protein 2 n=1 Tax=Neodiprion fabricii TaxID=2872261 RepID=UPI001ED94DDE|nr:PCI domain-containing protein 2 [Neodiprion fabricii]XP_046428243.1 PCI domain-containing protein 2 [Neodiprion fabricii]XP_046621236.1 PCI domain-containing protein 2 [Neodiprion virginianus]XP_046621237.1 PCI domain-containing protein 2 [Neodiprion virginianus]